MQAQGAKHAQGLRRAQGAKRALGYAIAIVLSGLFYGGIVGGLIWLLMQLVNDIQLK